MSASGDPHERTIGGATRTVGVIGWPVDHSLSPTIHNAAFAALEMDWVYVSLPVPPDSIEEAVRGLGALGFVGANVTMPHKTDAARLVDERSDDAERLRAVNTIVVGADGTMGHNTDAPGFARFLADDAGFDAKGREVLLLGGGGASRACALAVAREGAARVTVAVRDLAQVDGVRAVVEGSDVPGVEVVGIGLADAPTVEADLVVNATPLGRAGETPPHPAFRETMVAVDLLYRPAVTPFQVAARDAGADAFGGLGLLLHQAALSFELWTGRVPPMAPMSAAAVRALAESSEVHGT